MCQFTLDHLGPIFIPCYPPRAELKILDNEISSVMMRMSPMVEGEVERAKRKRATVIVTRFILSLTKAVLQKSMLASLGDFQSISDPGAQSSPSLPSRALTFMVPAAARIVQ